VIEKQYNGGLMGCQEKREQAWFESLEIEPNFRLCGHPVVALLLFSAKLVNRQLI
jgi:putative copper export protein